MYVDATEEPWVKDGKGFRMYSYITSELPSLISSNFGDKVDLTRQSIFGHSMGGHGALICSLKNPGKYKSVSAFSPMCNASEAPWGIKSFSAYLGTDKTKWKEYDACELASKYNGPNPHILVDQGDEDKFYNDYTDGSGNKVSQQLSTKKFIDVCANNSIFADAQINIQPGYDHSYFFISTFMESHIKHHAKYLNDQ
eukprot:TRINITY_DN3723_c0_g1_i2.p1 TRINITY_DN3723_c0_g1~~TRINITY_DN3723_c0_g1_i2.p1  ORF type:complete len:197 (-),score=58.52 TRINITY_DN3723_c0_g1_i2:72-662(-)